MAGVVLLGGIASANSAIQQATPDLAAPALVAATPTAEPAEEVAEIEPSATPEPTVDATMEPEVVADPAVFKADALRDLQDFKKDLDDMDKTLDEDGFWRLLSNSAELGFNLGQLQAHDAPDEIVSKWDAGLETLDAKIDAITDEIGNDDSKATRTAIANAREQANNLIKLVKKIE